MRGHGVFPINQLAFDEREMKIPQGSEQWYDALAHSPNAIVNSYQVHLAAKLSVGLLRDDQALPDGWRYEPSVRPYRLPNRNPVLEGVTDEDRMGPTKFPDGIDLFRDRSEPEMRNVANSLRAFQAKPMKGEFSARREEVRREFQAPAQSSDGPNPVFSTAAEAPGPGADVHPPMPDVSTADARIPEPTPLMKPPTYIPPRAKVKVQQNLAARVPPLPQPFIDASALALTPLSPVSEIPTASAAARAAPPSQSYMPQSCRMLLRTGRRGGLAFRFPRMRSLSDFPTLLSRA